MDNYQIAYLITLAVQILISITILARQGYFYKKGQNKADKEDIAELTKIVEGVKAEFIQENAKITSDLDILKDRRGKSYTQAQQAIINYFTDLQSFISYSIDISIRQLSREKAEKSLLSIKEKKYKFDVSMSAVEILIDDNKGGKLGGEIALNCLHLMHHIEGSLRKMLPLIATEQHLIALLENPEKLTHEETLDLKANIEKNYAAQKLLGEEYYEKRFELLKPIFELQQQFKLFAQQFLKA
ncbi:hypothetical protein [Mucilaginibacter endophyticus]|uniref:hypothetical protein n=1 Tax=Mucilaginibacter endophyticus TaxID=2675003 RepID=UPI000E0CD62F|nr:hypothetical protein [Mucilaginibacter endophyticus]